MNHHEITLAKALEGVVFVPGIPTKRFAKDMASLARNSPDQELTVEQRKYLCEIVVKFRRQIPGDVVALARTMMTVDTAGG